MAIYKTPEELTVPQSVGPYDATREGDTETLENADLLEVFQPERGRNLVIRNPNPNTNINESVLQNPYSNQVFIEEEVDKRLSLGTVTYNNRDYWEANNFNDSTYQPYLTEGAIGDGFETHPVETEETKNGPVIRTANHDIYNNENDSFKWSVDALPFVINPNDNEIINLDRYWDKDINSTEYYLATEGKINYYLQCRTSGRFPSGNINPYASKPKRTRMNGVPYFDAIISASLDDANPSNDSNGFYLFKLNWGDGTEIEYTNEPLLLEQTTMLEHYYDRPGFYVITGLVYQTSGTQNDGKGLLRTWEKFQTTMLLNPSINYELGLYDYNNFASIGGLTHDSRMVKSLYNIIGVNTSTSPYDTTRATSEVVRDLNLLDQLQIFNTLSKLDYSTLPQDFKDIISPYQGEISDTDVTIMGCPDPTATNYWIDDPANGYDSFEDFQADGKVLIDDGSCLYMKTMTIEVDGDVPIPITFRIHNGNQNPLEVTVDANSSYSYEFDIRQTQQVDMITGEGESEEELGYYDWNFYKWFRNGNEMMPGTLFTEMMTSDITDDTTIVAQFYYQDETAPESPSFVFAANADNSLDWPIPTEVNEFITAYSFGSPAGPLTIFNEQESPEPDILIYWENNNQEDDTTLSHYQITRITEIAGDIVTEIIADNIMKNEPTEWHERLQEWGVNWIEEELGSGGNPNAPFAYAENSSINFPMDAGTSYNVLQDNWFWEEYIKTEYESDKDPNEIYFEFSGTFWDGGAINQGNKWIMTPSVPGAAGEDTDNFIHYPANPLFTLETTAPDDYGAIDISTLTNIYGYYDKNLPYRQYTYEVRAVDEAGNISLPITTQQITPTLDLANPPQVIPTENITVQQLTRYMIKVNWIGVDEEWPGVDGDWGYVQVEAVNGTAASQILIEQSTIEGEVVNLLEFLPDGGLFYFDSDGEMRDWEFRVNLIDGTGIESGYQSVPVTIKPEDNLTGQLSLENDGETLINMDFQSEWIYNATIGIITQTNLEVNNLFLRAYKKIMNFDTGLIERDYVYEDNYDASLYNNLNSTSTLREFVMTNVQNRQGEIFHIGLFADNIDYLVDETEELTFGAITDCMDPNADNTNPVATISNAGACEYSYFINLYTDPDPSNNYGYTRAYVNGSQIGNSNPTIDAGEIQNLTSENQLTISAIELDGAFTNWNLVDGPIDAVELTDYDGNDGTTVPNVYVNFPISPDANHYGEINIHGVFEEYTGGGGIPNPHDTDVNIQIAGTEYGSVVVNGEDGLTSFTLTDDLGSAELTAYVYEGSDDDYYYYFQGWNITDGSNVIEFEDPTNPTYDDSLSTTIVNINDSYNGADATVTCTFYRVPKGDGSGTCFLKDTMITMVDGRQLPIQDIQVGMEVMSYDEETNSITHNKVVETFFHPPKPNDISYGVYLIINNNIRVTTNHAILVDTNDRSSYKWPLADTLEVGDYMFDKDLNKVRIDSIERVEEVVDTYNFEVENSHTYIAENVIVHNIGGDGPGGGKGRIRDLDDIETGQVTVTNVG